MGTWCTAGVIVALLACSKKSPQPEPAAERPVAAANPDGGSAAIAANDATATPDLAGAFDAAFTKAKLTLTPLSATVHPTAPDVFLGWSQDGSRYLSRATFEIEEEPGIEGVGFTLVEVRDTLSQQVIELYQDKLWPTRKQLEARLAAASDDAKRVPLATWDAAKPAAELVGVRSGFIAVGKPIPGKAGPHARRESPAGASVTAMWSGKAPHRSKLGLVGERHGYTFEWTGFATAPDPARRTTRPALVLSARTKVGTFPLVTVTIATTYETLHEAIDESEPTVSGEVRAYWSPAGTHVALNVLEIPEGGHEEMGLGLVTRTFVRAIGPQIKVVAAGASYETARKAAAVFTYAGLPVTQVEQGKATVAGGVIYHRGDAGKQTAEALAKVVPGLRLEPLTGSGWLDVIVTLGS